MKIYKTNIEIERYEGIWAFSYISDYILSIVPQDKHFVIILQDISVSENVKLIPLKISSFFMDFFVRGSLDNIRIRIYPKTKSGKIGIEIKDKELFFKKSDHANLKKINYDFYITQGDIFPDWITGYWKCYAGGLRIYVQKKNKNELGLKILDDDKKIIKMYECGYIDHTGILLTLSGKEWIDPPQIFEILFDSFKEEIACYTHVMPIVRQIVAHVE